MARRETKGNAAMKLDLGKAWTDATAMLNANREVVIIVAGLFFFLPYFAFLLFFPELLNPETVQAPPGADPDAAMDAMLGAYQAIYGKAWPAMIVYYLLQMVGSLALLALLTDRAQPTVGEALKIGATSFPTYLASQILFWIGAVLLLALPIGILAAVAPLPIVVLVGFLLAIVVIYLMIKFTLVSPVIAIEREMNPVTAMQRSWALTKGNSFLIAAFIILLGIALIVISLIVQTVFGLIFAAFGGAIEGIGNGFIAAAFNTFVVTLFLAVTAAIHRQLAGTSTEKLSETFD